MELIDRSQFAEKIIAIGIEELNKVVSNSKYKMDFNIEVIKDLEDTFYMMLKEVEDLREIKRIRRRLFKTSFNFVMNTNETDEVNKLALIDYYEREYGLDLFDMIEYNMGVEDVLYVLAILHELGHMHKILLDFSKHGYLKEDLEDMVEYRFFLMSSMIFSPSSDTKFKRYRMLNREKYADDFSVAMFRKHFDRIIKIFN
jgi:hypothetical protein